MRVKESGLESLNTMHHGAKYIILIRWGSASRLQSQVVNILDLRTPKLGLKYRQLFTSLLCFI